MSSIYKFAFYHIGISYDDLNKFKLAEPYHLRAIELD